jgi:hypothetical protein
MLLQAEVVCFQDGPHGVNQFLIEHGGTEYQAFEVDV